MKHLCVAAALCAALGFAGSASAALVTYDVSMNFDPTRQEGGTGVGTITGTFTIDTTALKLTKLDLTEKTNTSDTFGGGFGSPIFTSLDFTDTALSSASAGQKFNAFGGLPYLFIGVQSGCCVFDGVEVGPGFQFDFAPRAGRCSRATSTPSPPRPAISSAT